MTISTRSNYYPSTPSGSPKASEYDTLKKSRFFDALDRSGSHKSFRRIAREYAPSLGTAARWKAQRIQLGSPSYRRTRKLAKRLRRPRIINPSISQVLVSPEKNPHRNQTIESQLKYFNVRASVRTVQRSLLKYTNEGRKYK